MKTILTIIIGLIFAINVSIAQDTLYIYSGNTVLFKRTVSTIDSVKLYKYYVPTLNTATPSSITSSNATCGGSITAIGGSTVTSRGVCWSTTSNPTISNIKTTDGSGAGTFTSSITGLSASTTYYARAYAINIAGIAYGSQVSFKTLYSYPVLTTTIATSITNTTAISGGNISSDGGSTITSRGVCWSTTSSPTIANSKTSDGSGSGTFTSPIIGLAANTTYYLRAYATNLAGTAYGNAINFTTSNSTNLYIGMNYLGGAIAYIDDSGKHGFVCSLLDNFAVEHPEFFSGAVGIFTGIEPTGVFGITKSYGRRNTDLIVLTYGSGNYAASICADMTDGGATAGEWYLPSINELNAIYLNRNELPNFGLYGSRLSSTQSKDVFNNYAWSLNWETGKIVLTPSLNEYWAFRAIRAF